MKTHSTVPSLLLVTACAALGLASCVVPGSYGSRGYASSTSGYGVYNALPPGYAGSAYYHGNRYYSGGRYETGSFNYQGRRYDSRYQQGNGQYLYGGQHQHYADRSGTPRYDNHAHLSPGAGFIPGTGPSWRP